jgi:preprotein translocase subunit SecF
MALTIVPAGTKLPFVRFRPAYFAFSGLLLALGIFLYATQGLNFGIDFRGGILIEVGTKPVNGVRPPAKIDEMRRRLGALKLGEVSLQEFGKPQDVLIRVEKQDGDERAQIAAIRKIRNSFSLVAFGTDPAKPERKLTNGSYLIPGVLNNAKIEAVQTALKGVKDVDVKAASGKAITITLTKPPAEAKALRAQVTAVKDALSTVQFRRQEFVGPQVGGELIEAGIIATVLALLAIMLYVWFRFEWQFAVAAVVALVHDVLLTIGLFAFLQEEFNLATVAAILTIAGYSINDTVVVFDRVRENLRKYKKMPMAELMNQSINETLSRTVMTSVTTLLALFSLFFFGGEIISGFSIALIWGVVIGTYSSICLAVPLLLLLNLKRSSLSSTDKTPADVGA